MTLPTAADPDRRPSRADRDAGLDAVKGLLVLLIVVGHSSPLYLAWSPATTFLYRFHVAGFLLLVGMRPAETLPWRAVADRAVRYLVPFAAYLVAAAALLLLVFGPRTGAAALQQARWLGQALWSGAASDCKQASGFSLFWFMPTLLSLTLLRSAWARVGKSAGDPWLWWPLLCVLQGLLPTGREATRQWPLGAAVAVWILPLVELAPLAAQWFAAHRRWGWLLWAVTAAAVAPLPWTNIGDLAVADWSAPAGWIGQNAMILLSFGAIYSSSGQLGKVAALRWLGRHSLGVYLGHSFGIQLALLLLGKAGWQPLGAHAALAILPVLALGLVAGWANAKLMALPAVQPWLAPKNARDFPLLRPLFTGPAAAT